MIEISSVFLDNCYVVVIYHLRCVFIIIIIIILLAQSITETVSNTTKVH